MDPVTIVHAIELPKAGLALAALLGTALVAHGDLPAWETSVFELVNRWPDALEPVLWAPMQLGSLFGPFVVAGAAWLGWRRWRPALSPLLAGLVAWEVAKQVKGMVGRGRPADLIDAVVRRPGTPIDGLGFVSGHTAVAFALACALSPWVGRWRWAGYGVAVVVGTARIHVAAHLPLDVVGGAALGLVLGELANTAVGVPDDRRRVAPRRRRRS